MKRRKQIMVAVGVVMNKEGKILLALRHEPTYPPTHHKWELPGGCIEFGETPQETVCREVLEETGYEVKVTRLIPYVHSIIWPKPAMDTQVLAISFLCTPVRRHGGPQNSEVEDLKWFFPNQTKSLDALPGLQVIIHAAGI